MPANVLDYAWIAWLALILIFVIVEMFTLEFTFLMIAIGSLGGLVSGLFGVPLFFQIVIAAALALLLLFGLRPPLLRALKKGGDPSRSNIAALLGMSGRVVIPLTPSGGQVKLENGETWTARMSLAADMRELPVGTDVLVTAIDGATAVVIPTERTTP